MVTPLSGRSEVFYVLLLQKICKTYCTTITFEIEPGSKIFLSVR